MALPALAGAAIGAGGNLLPPLPDYAGMGMQYLGTGMLTGNWGGTSKERKNQIHDIRTLRRREYQDMVHSLQKAGLNPVLAVGATPGHASAQPVAGLGNFNMPTSGGSAGAGSAMAANRAAGVAESKAPSEVRKNMQAATAIQLGIPNILQQWEINQATIDQIRQNTRTGAALELLHGQDAINKGASARELDERVRQYQQFGMPGQSWEGIVRQAVTGKGGAIGNSARALLDAIIGKD